MAMTSKSFSTLAISRDLKLEAWLQRCQLAYARLNALDSIRSSQLYDYPASASTFERITEVPKLHRHDDNLSAECFEDGLIIAIRFCRHLYAWYSSDRLTDLWKKIHDTSTRLESEIKPSVDHVGSYSPAYR